MAERSFWSFGVAFGRFEREIMTEGDQYPARHSRIPTICLSVVLIWMQVCGIYVRLMENGTLFFT